MAAQQDTRQILDPNAPVIWTTATGGKRVGESLHSKLNRQTSVTPTCHLWTGATNAKGYGIMQVDRRSRLVPRVVFRLTYGYWPDLVRHSCDNPPCINPAHLLDGTKLSNANDRDTRGRNAYSNRTHCPVGHEYTPENTAIRKRGKNRPGQTYRQCKACNQHRRKV